MSTFGDMHAATVVPALMSHMGESVTYTPISTGTGAAITAIRLRDAGVTGLDAPDQATRVFLVQEADVAQPVAGDTIADGDGTWHVQVAGLNHRPGDPWKVQCSRPHLNAYSGSGIGG